MLEQKHLQTKPERGRIWRLSAVLNERGDLYLKQRRLEEAYAAFSESLAISTEGSQEEVASALYGLARVAAAKGDLVEARRLGWKCLDILEPMGNRLKDTVREWLGTIPGGEELYGG